MNKLPGVQDVHPLFGTLHHFPGLGEDGLEFSHNEMIKHKYFSRNWLGPFACVIIAYHPDIVKEIIKHSVKPRNKGLLSSNYDMGVSWLGESLVNTNGQRWYRKRRLLTPSFHFDVLKNYVKVFKSCADIFSAKLEKFSKSNEDFDLQNVISLYTLDVILRCCFSLESNCQLTKGRQNEYSAAIRELQYMLMLRGLNPFHMNESIYKSTPTGKKWYKLCKKAHEETERIMKERKKEIEEHGETQPPRTAKDFLDTLLTARDPDGNGLAWQEIRGECDTFLLAGHETSASGILWTLISLAQHPEYQSRVLKEVNDVLGQNEEVEWGDIAKLQFTGQCIKESLRRNAASWAIGRKTTEDIEFQEYLIPKDTLVILHLYQLHTNPHVWKDPLEYNPDRFDPEETAKMDPYQFIPFSAGSRNCIGQHFAMNEMKLAVAQVVKQFKLETDPKKPIKRHLSLTLKAEGGAFLKFTPR